MVIRFLLALALFACDRIDPLVRDYYLEATTPGSACTGKAQLEGQDGKYAGGFSGQCDGWAASGLVLLDGDRLDFLALGGYGVLAEARVLHARVDPGRSIEGDGDGWHLKLVAVGGGTRPSTSPR